VESVFPEVVAPGPDGLKSVDYAALLSPIVESLKELIARIEVLEASSGSSTLRGTP
jgi:hypothetical protein